MYYYLWGGGGANTRGALQSLINVLYITSPGAGVVRSQVTPA